MEYQGFALDIKQLTDDGQFEGYAAVYGNLDRQGDVIKTGAFKRSLRENKGRVPMLMGHDTGRMAGFGTGAEEDDHGLKVWGEFTLACDDGRNGYALAKHAAKLKQFLKMSIGYGVREGGASRDEETGIRTLSDLNLYEYSLVAIPANPLAQLTAVKGIEHVKTIRDFESFLRDSGYSKEAACTIASRGYNALTDRRDTDGGELAGLLKHAEALQLSYKIKELDSWVRSRN